MVISNLQGLVLEEGKVSILKLLRGAKGAIKGCLDKTLPAKLVELRAKLWQELRIDVSAWLQKSRLSSFKFADDLVIFCEASLEHVINIRRVLRVFELSSGLQLNLNKSCIFAINISDNDLASWADSVGCKVCSFSAEYLGLPLSPRRNFVSLWEPILD
ncbi:hypothetical protein V6N12_014053 [Hibiscus sabdariffa]|uniref:Reverse transcriptase domain-containing protein n=1 Tax=Hibiscus sabdariffa TaxID=183260 RepID=A0ABR2D0G3_9ROSI